MFHPKRVNKFIYKIPVINKFIYKIPV
jgi:hypothetical protein